MPLGPALSLLRDEMRRRPGKVSRTGESQKTCRFHFLCVTSAQIPVAYADGNPQDDLLAQLQPGDKAALLLVHFGTTYDETRAKTIDAINAKAAEAFPELDVREAWTSRIILRKLKGRGVNKQTPREALLSLAAAGYTHVVVQSTTLLEGAEMESLRRDAAEMAPFFKEIRVGTPLLYAVEDCAKVAGILAARHPDGPSAESRRASPLPRHYARGLSDFRDRACPAQGRQGPQSDPCPLPFRRRRPRLKRHCRRLETGAGVRRIPGGLLPGRDGRDP